MRRENSGFPDMPHARRPLIRLGGKGDVVANLRMAIEQAWLLTQ